MKTAQPRSRTRIGKWSVWAAALLGITVAVPGQPQLLSVEASADGWVHLAGKGQTNHLLTLLGSAELRTWNPLAVLCQELGFGPETNAFVYHDPAAPLLGERFYRVIATEPQPTNDWRNQVTVALDPFLCSFGQEGLSSMRWIKFLLLPSEPFRVYYQDSSKYLFHYQFARERFAAFRGMTSEMFDTVSLRTNNQQAVLGAVLFPALAPGSSPAWPSEYAIQIAGLDPYPPEQIREWFELVRSTVIAPPEVKPFYFPAFEQKAAALTHEAYFATNGIPVGSSERWGTGDQAYAAGWALGPLKFFTAPQIAAAYLDGRLLPGDILLTDDVPVDMPLVAGVLTLSPATPNSHVAILASSYGIPFGYLANTNEATKALGLVGREVLLQVSLNNIYGRIQLLDLTGTLGAETRAQILDLKMPAPVSIQPKQRYGAYTAPVDPLVPEDTRFFGGKAANFGFLRRAIPNNSPPAIAISLDLWDDFMAQSLPGGKSLRAEIVTRLANYTNYPPDLPAVTADLAIIRDLISKTASFTPAQQQALISALQAFNFDSWRNIRFRSSSNAEDSQIFTAAGLYDSYSGCLADDLDGDTSGPSHCDPTEDKERGVFRALQKVYASFYNDNAFLERLRHKLNETQLGMAVLVHYSVPDDQEMANGVATLKVHRWWNGSRYVLQTTGDLVTQKGAVSVTNPRTDAQPERVQVSDYGYGLSLSLQGRSSLVPLGGYVLAWEQEYRELMALLTAVVAAYSQHFPSKTDFLLDFEYKKNVPGELQVKQVRELPPVRTDTVAPFLLGGSWEYRVQQGEGWSQSILARQRLKSRLSLQAPTIQLTDAVLAQGIYSDALFEFLNGTRPATLTGGFTNWPNAVHLLTNASASWIETRESWTHGAGPDQRTFTLSTTLPRQRPIATPFITDRELARTLTVTYAKPIADPFTPTTPVTNESVYLASYFPPTGTRLSTNYSPLTAVFPSPNPRPKSISVGTYTYSDPPRELPPDGPPIIIKTFPLPYYDEILITGLISEPILLTSYYAQSSIPAHHNWGSWHVFDPWLDPAVPQRQLAELLAANIQLLYVSVPPPWGGDTIYQILGLDGQFRRW